MFPATPSSFIVDKTVADRRHDRMAVGLGIGNATLDNIRLIDHYPDENDEIRCDSRTLRCGGNTANTLIVLRHVRHAGVLDYYQQTDRCAYHYTFT